MVLYILDPHDCKYQILKNIKSVTPICRARLIRWNDGRLEMRRLEINRLRMGRSALSYVDLPQLELDSEIDGVGWSEAVVYNDSIIGLTTSQSRSKCTAVPSFFVEQVLDEVEKANGIVKYVIKKPIKKKLFW